MTWAAIRPEVVTAAIGVLIAMVIWGFKQIPASIVRDVLKEIPEGIGQDVAEIKRTMLRTEDKADKRDEKLNTRIAAIEQWSAEVRERHRREDERHG